MDYDDDDDDDGNGFRDRSGGEHETHGPQMHRIQNGDPRAQSTDSTQIRQITLPRSATSKTPFPIFRSRNPNFLAEK